METPSIPGLVIVGELGRGGSGRVFRVQTADGSKTHALKLSHHSPRHSPQDLAFKHEYHLHARLRHAHILRAHEFQEYDEYCRYYTMDFVDATSLRELYQSRGIRALGVVALQICRALEYTHAQGTLHGDIKPANLLVTMRNDEPHAVLADFGHAQRIGLESSFVTGTLSYLAPEGMNGWRLDARSDLYSLGATLFEAICGHLPYAVSTPKELYHAIREYPPPSILEREPKLDPNWARLVDSLLSRNRDDRPPSATATAARITAWLGDGPALPGAPGAGFAINATLGHVGHRAELDQLLQAARDANGAVVVLGENGVGKSRLVEELARRIELDGGLVQRSDARDTQPAGLRLLRRVFQEGCFRDITRPQPSSPRVPSIVGRLFHHERQAELERLVDGFLAQDRTPRSDRVYIFDSLERADPDSLAFLMALENRLRGKRNVLLCLVGQGTPSAAWLKALPEVKPAKVVVLPALERGDVQELVLRHLGEAPYASGAAEPALDEEELSILVSWMMRQAGGNPRRIETALCILVNKRYLTRSGVRWTLDKGRMLQDPALLEAEPDGVLEYVGAHESLRPYVELASVVGSEFDASILAALPEFESREFREFLADSVRRGLVAEAPGGGTHYRFRDPAIARVLYDSLPAVRRRELHALVAAHLEKRLGDEPSVEIAEHLERAGERAKARDTFVLAGRVSRRRGAYQEAGRSFHKAWSLHTAKDRESIPEFGAEWIRTLHANSHYDEGASVAQEMLEAVRGRQRESSVDTIRMLRGACIADAGRRREGLAILERLLDGSTALDPQLEAPARITFGRLIRPDKPDVAQDSFERARAIGVRLHNQYLVGSAELQLGIVAWQTGDAPRALEIEVEAQRHLLEAEAYELLPAVWSTQAMCYWQLSEVRKAARFHRRAAESFRRQHRRAEAARSYQNLAHVLTELGHWAESEEALGEAERLNRTNHGLTTMSYLKYHRARLSYYRGQFGPALDFLDEAIRLATEADARVAAAGHRVLRGLVALAKSDADSLRDAAQRVLVDSRQIQYPWGIAAGHYLLGEEARLRADHHAALEYLNEALAVAQKSQLADLEFPIQLARAELLADSHAPAEAKRQLARTREMQLRSESILWNGLWHLSDGRVAQTLEDHERACSSLSTAYEIFANLGSRKLEADALVELAESRNEIGNRNAALSAWKHAQALYRHLGLAPPRCPIAEAGVAETALPTVDRLLQTAASVAREITMPQSSEQVLERILDVAVTYLGSERGVIALTDPETGELRVRLARNIDRESIRDGLVICRSALDRSTRTDTGMVHSDDALMDAELSQHESVRACRVRSLVALPIRSGKETLGALYMDHRELTDLFGPEERLFLRFIADMAATGIRNAQRFELAEDQARNLRGELAQDEFTFPGTVVGRNPRMLEVVRRSIRGIRSGRIVLLTGESGVGKDHFARILHAASRRPGDFVNCPLPTLPPTLMRSLFFGCCKGTATDVMAHAGFVESAQGGTLFLNEIAELSIELQGVLLDFLESREFQRMGGTNRVRLDANIICATNAKLIARVEEGTFREDLYYRLTECDIEIPPLRNRREDIPDLVELFTRQGEAKMARERTIVHPLAMDLLLQSQWHGNVRELRNCILSALDQTTSPVIERRHLDSRSLRDLREQPGRSEMRDAIDAVEVRRIHDAMARSGGVITRAANHLGITEAALRRRIKRHHLGHLVLQRRQARNRH